MPDYERFCPISLATEVIADRWTPLIMRELLMGNTRFNDIARGLPGISRSLLTQRLRHLERKGVVDTVPSTTGRGREYHLSPSGRDLESVIDAMGRWAVEWLFDEIRPHEVDAVTLMWWMHRQIDVDALPAGRVVLEVRHTAPQRIVLWMVFDRGEVSVCVQHPGFDVDVVVTTSTPVIGEVFQGFRSWGEAVADGAITVDGPPRLVREVPRWFTWSSFAEATRARLERVPVLD
ncbi:winged helix-turn-helix transcriptional regulator [Actinomarinicola tropica]|uniref:Transcriptional regulator n=1 Tax=Actinomarinicola tropica TaxID=2789776 RepID=A0A5Q2RLX2_9ACTN|nr:helix-turn-helix domain-containing protein [Actinomarinicola tropica]QGG95426.1 transcriptional regulator [Actinomarinicola tropica]